MLFNVDSGVRQEEAAGAGEDDQRRQPWLTRDCSETVGVPRKASGCGLLWVDRYASLGAHNIEEGACAVAGLMRPFRTKDGPWPLPAGAHRGRRSHGR